MTPAAPVTMFVTLQRQIQVGEVPWRSKPSARDIASGGGNEGWEWNDIGCSVVVEPHDGVRRKVLSSALRGVNLLFCYLSACHGTAMIVRPS